MASARAAVKEYCLQCCGGHDEAWELDDGTIAKPYRPFSLVAECDTKVCRLHPIRAQGRVPKGRSTKGLIKDHCFGCLAGYEDKVKWGKTTYTRKRPGRMVAKCRIMDCPLYPHRT